MSSRKTVRRNKAPPRRPLDPHQPTSRKPTIGAPTAGKLRFGTSSMPRNAKLPGSDNISSCRTIPGVLLREMTFQIRLRPGRANVPLNICPILVLSDPTSGPSGPKMAELVATRPRTARCSSIGHIAYTLADFHLCFMETARTSQIARTRSKLIAQTARSCPNSAQVTREGQSPPNAGETAGRWSRYNRPESHERQPNPHELRQRCSKSPPKSPGLVGM